MMMIEILQWTPLIIDILIVFRIGMLLGTLAIDIVDSLSWYCALPEKYLMFSPPPARMIFEFIAYALWLGSRYIL